MLDTFVDILDTIVDKVYKVLGILDTTVDTVYRVLDMLDTFMDTDDTFMDTDDTESWTFWTQRLCKIVESGKPPYICVKCTKPPPSGANVDVHNHGHR